MFVHYAVDCDETIQIANIYYIVYAVGLVVKKRVMLNGKLRGIERCSEKYVKLLAHNLSVEKGHWTHEGFYTYLNKKYMKIHLFI